MLILLDTGHIDQEWDPRHVIQMDRRAVARVLPAVRRERRQARAEIEPLGKVEQR